MDELIIELQEWAAQLNRYADTAYGAQLTPIDACNLGRAIEEAVSVIKDLREGRGIG